MGILKLYVCDRCTKKQTMPAGKDLMPQGWRTVLDKILCDSCDQDLVNFLGGAKIVNWAGIKQVLDSWREQAKKNEIAFDLLNNIQLDLEALAKSEPRG